MDLGLAGRRALVTGAGKGEAAGEGRWRSRAGLKGGTRTNPRSPQASDAALCWLCRRLVHMLWP